MKKSVRLLAAVVGVCLLCGCTAKETKATRTTKEQTTASESDEKETTTETSEKNSESSDKETENSSDKTEDTTEDTTASEETADSSAKQEEPKAMKEYEAFLKDEAKVDISFLQGKKDSMYFLDMDDADFPDRELKRSEFYAFIKAHTWQTSMDGTGPKEKYTFIDCGQDGEMELLYLVENLGEFCPQFVIKSVDGKLKMTAILESWSRNDTFTNSAGFLTSTGSGGAALRYTEYGYLNEKGEAVITASVSSQFANFDIINPEFAKMEEYCSSHNLTADYYIDEVKFGQDSTPYFALLHAQNKDIDPELQKLFDETSVKKMGFEEYLAKIKESVGEKRYNAPAVTWTELK